MNVCPACTLGLIAECFNPDEPCQLATQPVNIITPSSVDTKTVIEPVAKDYKDPKSTGRKQAAVKYEIPKGMVCEWLGLKNAGGGQHPIIGCTGNQATNRHHGPDKDTLNNNQGNVHRICTKCHNRWHARNDPSYPEYLIEIGGAENINPHDAETKATSEELYQNEMEWEKRK